MSPSGEAAPAGDPDEGVENWSFEQALKRLEELVRRLEQGNAPLEASLTEYAEAVELLRVCQGKLDDAQERIEVLCGLDADGNPVSKPLGGDGQLSLEEKRSARGARRSTAAESRSVRKPADVDDSGQLF